MATGTAVIVVIERRGKGKYPAAERGIRCGHGPHLAAGIKTLDVAHAVQAVFGRRTGQLTGIDRPGNCACPAANSIVVAAWGEARGPSTHPAVGRQTAIARRRLAKTGASRTAIRRTFAAIWESAHLIQVAVTRLAIAIERTKILAGTATANLRRAPGRLQAGEGIGNGKRWIHARRGIAYVRALGNQDALPAFPSASAGVSVPWTTLVGARSAPTCHHRRATGGALIVAGAIGKCLIERRLARTRGGQNGIAVEGAGWPRLVSHG